MLDALGILIQGEYLASLAQQMDQVSSVPASGIEHAHAGCDVSTQNLIEDVNIDLSKLLLYGERHSVSICN